MPDIQLPNIQLSTGMITFIAVLVVIYLVFKIFKLSIKLFVKFLINALIGAVLLFVFNFVFYQKLGIKEFNIPINWVTAAITGVLGVPGVIIMLIVKLLGYI